MNLAPIGSGQGLGITEMPGTHLKTGTARRVWVEASGVGIELCDVY